MTEWEVGRRDRALQPYGSSGGRRVVLLRPPSASSGPVHPRSDRVRGLPWSDSRYAQKCIMRGSQS